MLNYISIACFNEEIKKDFLNYIRDIFTMPNHSCRNTEHSPVVFSIYFFERIQNILYWLGVQLYYFVTKR